MLRTVFHGGDVVNARFGAGVMVGLDAMSDERLVKYERIGVRWIQISVETYRLA